MFYKRKRRWEIKESAATPEHVFWNRRKLLTAAGLGAAGLGSIGLASRFGAPMNAEIAPAALAATDEKDLTAQYYPFEPNDRFVLDREVTDELLASTYNNFYEFGSHKRISRAAQALQIRPWEIAVDGEVEKPFTIGIDDLVKRMPREERLYRHRCVEAWSMAVPWSGFTLKSFVELARPLSSAKYVRMETFLDSKVASGQLQFWYPWPYVEGLTMEEATNDLAFMVTGIYGKPLPKQFGAPLRLALPWKYGFKSIKSIVKVSFTKERPVSFWEEIQPAEYGFWANVNPEVPHPRWSQATEQVLGTGERVPTLLYNGYAEEVAHLYKGLEGETLYR